MNEQDRYTHADDGVAATSEVAGPAFPWPPAEDESPASALGRTWQGASLEPRRFFSALPRDLSLGATFVYYLIIGIAVEGAQLFWAFVLPPLNLFGMNPAELGEQGAWGPVIDFLLSPVLLLLSLFIAAGAAHVLLKLFGGADGDYGLTLRVFAFAYSPQILGIVPVIGGVAGFVWMVVVAIIGLSAAHRTSTGRAAAAVLVPVTIGLFFVAVAALIMATSSTLFEL